MLPEASSRLRSRAASRAAISAARTPWFSSSRMALIVVPHGRGDVLAELDGVFAAVAEHRGRADGGLDDEVVGLVPGQAEEDARVGHGLDQVEEVRRAGAGEGGAGVLLGFGDAECLADGAEDLFGVREIGLARVAAMEMTDMASSTRAGVFVITRTTGVPAARRSSKKEVGMPAAPLTTRRSAGVCGASSSRRVAMSWGLTVRMSVSAVFAASALVTGVTP